jgi:hypothetical protein
MNIKRFLTLSAIGVLALVGCNRAPNNVPTSGFHLGVEEISNDGDVRLTHLTIRSTAPAAISVDSEGSHHTVTLPAEAAGSGTVTLMASRVAPSNQPWAYMQTLIRTKTANGGSGGATAFEALPQDTQLADFFIITAKNGDYVFDTPVEVATLRGKPVTLTLKRPAH